MCPGRVRLAMLKAASASQPALEGTLLVVVGSRWCRSLDELNDQVLVVTSGEQVVVGFL
jgi:hypothetical protein